eukprot:NODE_992_length_1721_cov_43.791092_g931_i0.p1 GENE.NODE_992_length_1721_cov_43.791092_g931_i0~~NODE_992_length_1721_cov_43.791092_g931_i0.p1  ORF type:complete len:541 (+),score=86.12 NODE_992_length_1721_cov_43.791092_g931_i0:50-1624(+)
MPESVIQMGEVQRHTAMQFLEDSPSRPPTGNRGALLKKPYSKSENKVFAMALAEWCTLPLTDRRGRLTADNMVCCYTLPLWAEQPSVKSASAICMWKGNLWDLECDCIVNITDQRCLGTAGPLDAAIHKAAGRLLARECASYPTELRVGQVRATKGYKLPAKLVLHAYTPPCENPDKLRACYLAALVLASTMGCRTIGLPCMGAVPKEKAVHFALVTVREWLDAGNGDKFDRIVFVGSPVEYRTYMQLAPFYFPIEAKSNARELRKLEPRTPPITSTPCINLCHESTPLQTPEARTEALVEAAQERKPEPQKAAVLAPYEFADPHPVPTPPAHSEYHTDHHQSTPESRPTPGNASTPSQHFIQAPQTTLHTYQSRYDVYHSLNHMKQQDSPPPRATIIEHPHPFGLSTAPPLDMSSATSPVDEHIQFVKNITRRSRSHSPCNQPTATHSSNPSLSEVPVRQSRPMQPLDANVGDFERPRHMVPKPTRRSHSTSTRYDKSPNSAVKFKPEQSRAWSVWMWDRGHL